MKVFRKGIKILSLSRILRNSPGLIILLSVLMSCQCWKTDEANNANTANKPPPPTPRPEVIKPGPYRNNLPPNFIMPENEFGKRITSEYGAVYVAKGGIVPPPTWMFLRGEDSAKWQAGVNTTSKTLGGFSLKLQTPAMNALLAAIATAQAKGVTITPRGADAAWRDYNDTVILWIDRVHHGIDHWVKEGRLAKTEGDRIKNLLIPEQMPEILRLEDQGIFFSKDLKKSILSSVAAPGASQHIFMLALDVEEHANPKVRAAMASQGWYQTVVSDLPHFTYLGVQESELPSLGLKKVLSGGRTYWVPSL